MSFMTKEEQAKKAAKEARKARQAAAEAAAAAKRAEEDRHRLEDIANQRWNECLSTLEKSVGILNENPWLIIQEPLFIHNYLDSLIEVLANLSKHQDELKKVKGVLQTVYESFVDLGKFAKTQPVFYVSRLDTIKRFVHLLEQVAHRGSDKALFPNVLFLLGPTLARKELISHLAEAGITTSLLAFARSDWIPTPATLASLLRIIKGLSHSEQMRELFMEDPGYDRLQALTLGVIEGFTEEQRRAASESLRAFPKADIGVLQQIYLAHEQDEASSAPADETASPRVDGHQPSGGIEDTTSTTSGSASQSQHTASASDLPAAAAAAPSGTDPSG